MSVSTAISNSNKKVLATIVVLLTMLSVLTGVSQPAHAAAGDVSGTVQAGTYVTMTKDGNSFTAYSGAGTSYAFTGLAAGDYSIKFLKYGYQTAWYSGSTTGATIGTTTTAASATVLTVGGTAITGINATLTAATGALSGTVYGANSANVTSTTGVTVTAYMDGSSTIAATTTASSTGTYSFSTLTAGNYKLKFTPDSNAYALEYYNNAATLAAGSSFTVDYTTPVTGVYTELSATGSIGGTVTDSSSAGIAATVGLYTSDGQLAKTNGSTINAVTANGSGVFSITGITPGTYYLRYSATNYLTEWNNDKLSLASATAITVGQGQAITGKDAILAPSSGAAGTVTTSATVAAVGSATEGATLTATIVTWTGPTEYTYQWKRGGSDIAGANGSTYVVTSDDVGSTLSVAVTGYIANYIPSTVTSASTATIQHGFSTIPTPTISGTTTVGYTLTASPGTWVPTPDSFTYAWYRDGVVVSGNTSNTYVLGTADAGKIITVLVEAHLLSYPTTTKLSAGTVAIGNLMTATPASTISGDAVVGKTLTAVNGAWLPAGVTFTYQWLRSGNDIAGATSQSYTLVAADVNTYISVRVTGALTGYTSVATVSAVTSPVLAALTATPAPTISGTTKVGNTLTADAGTWSPATVTLSYQWFRDGVAIVGATGATYTLVAEDDLKFIVVKVTGSKVGYGNVTTASVSTQIGERFTYSPTPTIKGNLYVGQTLTASVGDWLPNPSFTFQWLRDGSAIAGASNLTYKIVTADVGHKLTFSVTGAKSGYINAVKVSAATGTIVAGKPFTKIVAPKISGTAKVGVTLRALTYAWSPAYTKVTYQWTRNNVAIAGATKSTYKLVIADRGSQIRVVITGTRSGYAATSKASSLTSKIK